MGGEGGRGRGLNPGKALLVLGVCEVNPRGLLLAGHVGNLWWVGLGWVTWAHLLWVNTWCI